MFFDETAKIEAHESEVLCVEFSPTDSGMEWKLIIFSKVKVTQGLIICQVLFRTVLNRLS